MKHVVIIGNGIAGTTAARHIRKRSDDKITIISGETDHFFSRTALMYIYMGHMRYEHTKPYEDWFWAKNRLELKKGWVRSIDFQSKTLELDQEVLNYDSLILATGSKPNKFGWPGQDLKGAQGLYSFQDLELMEKNTQSIKHAVVVGGGLIGIEMAEMLHSRGIHVTFLVREKNFWDVVLPENEAKMINRHIKEYNIDLRLNTELAEIMDNGKGHVGSVRTKNGEEIPCEFVGLTVGVSPNIDFLRDTKLKIDKGILVDKTLKTNIKDVYAIGDCSQISEPESGRKSIEPIWYTGRMMGETVAQTITGNELAYNPGVWFNSAKFFDIEYQTYGYVPAKPKENVDSIYWEDHKKAVRIVFDPQSTKVLGVNVLGIRMKHKVWEQWISEGQQLKKVIINFRDCLFDPEFSKSYLSEVRGAYRMKFPQEKLTPEKKGLLEKIFN